MTSAWAVGSRSVMLRFHPRPTMRPSQTTTAPTGTSPASSARWAERRASSIQSSSEAAVDAWAPGGRTRWTFDFVLNVDLVIPGQRLGEFSPQRQRGTDSSEKGSRLIQEVFSESLCLGGEI